MTSSPNSTLAIYRDKWPPRSPDLSRQQYDDEVKLLKDGVLDFTVAPVTGAIIGVPPNGKKLNDEARNTKYLWVISPEKIPYILENGEQGSRLKRKYVSHTNLTGGKPAHSGGELWFKDEETVWICGGSSRYTPRSAEELEDIAECFRKLGYEVINMGWDEGTNKPSRFFRG